MLRGIVRKVQMYVCARRKAIIFRWGTSRSMYIYMRECDPVEYTSTHTPFQPLSSSAPSAIRNLLPAVSVHLFLSKSHPPIASQYFEQKHLRKLARRAGE